MYWRIVLVILMASTPMVLACGSHDRTILRLDGSGPSGPTSGPSGPTCRTGCPCGRSCISCRDRCSMAAPILADDELDAATPADATNVPDGE